MKNFLVGECNIDNIYSLVDPTSFLEGAFEYEVVKALNCLQSDYWCGVFSGAFILEGDRRIADLAMIHRDFSHWFVIEVELAGHSLEHHVLPQVRCFRYGEPDTTCITSLTRAFPQFSREQAEAVLDYIPRHVAVISNVVDFQWTTALGALDVQHLVVSVYKSKIGVSAYELEGQLMPRSESIGFASFSAVDNSLRLAKKNGLAVGDVQIIDHFGILSTWKVREDSAGVLWISKLSGPALLEHGSYVQIIKAYDGRIFLKESKV